MTCFFCLFVFVFLSNKRTYAKKTPKSYIQCALDMIKPPGEDGNGNKDESDFPVKRGLCNNSCH